MKKGFIIIIFLSALITISCSRDKTVIDWVASTPEVKWQTNQLLLEPSAETADSAIFIYPDRRQQLIEGFGGCFNELGWEALQQVSEEDRANILQALFDTISGCRFHLCRMPIGANDYAVDWYSHNETAGDFEMSHFSIDRDKQRLIPYIREAQKLNPRLAIWASPWCPPTWMKTNGHYACRPAEVNDLPEEGRGQEMVSQFRMEEPYLKAYALYFSKFIEAYGKEGIKISAVHVQNEPNSCQNFPSCIWTPGALATFIGKYLGPQMAADHPETDIWLGTIERQHIERIDTILTDPEAARFIRGVGFQWAGKGAIAQVKEKYPGYKLMQTETECGDGSNDWKAAEHTFDLLKHYFNNGANAYMYWNLVLNETGKSQWGWKQNSMISIDSNTKGVTYNPEFYLMKHFSHYIHPGSYKIESSDSRCLSFKTDEGLVIIYYNEGSKTTRSFMIGDRHFQADLDEKSFNTFFVKEI